MKKIKQILLVDDSTATNFFNKTIIQKTGLVEEIKLAKNGKEALQCITNSFVPDLIFLDINMPVMNGWEFLTAFSQLDVSLKKSTIILMIGVELSSEDHERMKQIPQIKEYKGKMLSKDSISAIISEYVESIETMV